MANVNQSAGDGPVSDSAAQSSNSALFREGVPPSAAVLPMRAGQLPVADLIDLYMRHYAGRDTTRLQRLTWWQAKLGQITIVDVSDDQIHAALEDLSVLPATYYAGTDVGGKPIFKAKGKATLLAPATINRYSASIAAVFTWAIKRRIAPKGWIHPCRSVERKTENNEKIRFLSDDERIRLLDACKASSWPLLYLLVLLALTTGARRGELLALRFKDIDLARSVAHCVQTKNGDAKTLPLVSMVVEELKALQGAPNALVFASSRNSSLPFCFESRYAEALKTAKVRNFRFHDLRHTCASMLAQNGATLLEIGDVLGHRQLAMTKRYSHLTVGHKAALVNRVLGELK